MCCCPCRRVLLFEGAADYIPGLHWGKSTAAAPSDSACAERGPGNLSGSPELGSYPQFPNLYEPGSAFPTSTRGGTWWPDA